MAVTQGSRLSTPVKRYVYRGCGIDTLTPDFETDIERAARERREAKARERERVKREKNAAKRKAAQDAERKRRADARAREQARRTERRARIERDFEEWRARQLAKQTAKPKRARVYSQPVNVPERAPRPRPSPGWKPMTGADIDDLLAEMEE